VLVIVPLMVLPDIEFLRTFRRRHFIGRYRLHSLKSGSGVAEVSLVQARPPGCAPRHLRDAGLKAVRRIGGARDKFTTCQTLCHN
jgi:hypothetical protein